MPEMRYAETADIYPSQCVVCGTDVGPYLHFPTARLTVPLADGQQLVDANLLICIGNAERPGCLPQAIEHPQIGGAAPWTLTGLLERFQAIVAEKDEQIDFLENKLVESEEQRSVTVPLAQLREFLNGNGHAYPTTIPVTVGKGDIYRIPETPPPDLTPIPMAPPHPDSTHARLARGDALVEGKMGSFTTIQ